MRVRAEQQCTPLVALSRTLLVQKDDAGECRLPTSSRQQEAAIRQTTRVDVLLVAIPIVVPLLAYSAYGNIVQLVSWLIDAGPGSWQARNKKPGLNAPPSSLSRHRHDWLPAGSRWWAGTGRKDPACDKRSHNSCHLHRSRNAECNDNLLAARTYDNDASMPPQGGLPHRLCPVCHYYRLQRATSTRGGGRWHMRCALDWALRQGAGSWGAECGRPACHASHALLPCAAPVRCRSFSRPLHFSPRTSPA